MITHGARLTADAVGTTARDAGNRAYGAAAVVGRSLQADIIDDRVLFECVRATVGRAVSHPHAIDVEAHDGRVTLCGPILQELQVVRSSLTRR